MPASVLYPLFFVVSVVIEGRNLGMTKSPAPPTNRVAALGPVLYPKHVAIVASSRDEQLLAATPVTDSGHSRDDEQGDRSYAQYQRDSHQPAVVGGDPLLRAFWRGIAQAVICCIGLGVLIAALLQDERTSQQASGHKKEQPLSTGGL